MEILTNNNLQVVNGELDFGQVKKDSQIKTTLTFKGNSLSNFEAVPGCRCTTTSPKVIDKNTIQLEVGYKDSHILGLFKKTITITYTENGVKQKTFLKIKGEII